MSPLGIPQVPVGHPPPFIASTWMRLGGLTNRSLLLFPLMAGKMDSLESEFVRRRLRAALAARRAVAALTAWRIVSGRLDVRTKGVALRVELNDSVKFDALFGEFSESSDGSELLLEPLTAFEPFVNNSTMELSSVLTVVPTFDRPVDGAEEVLANTVGNAFTLTGSPFSPLISFRSSSDCCCSTAIIGDVRFGRDLYLFQLFINVWQ